jgi:pimeloyl-ACP methyl ester carboxylesterase
VIHQQIFEADGKAFNVAVGPVNGPPLLMFHGVTRRWQTFTPVLPALMSRYQIFAFDFPGHGLSDRTNRGYRVADFAHSLETLLSLPPFSTQHNWVIYGHSLGSMVAGDLAGKFGRKVSGVVLEDPPFHTMGERMKSTSLQSYFEGVSPFAGSTAALADIVRGLAEVRMTHPETAVVTRLGDVRDEPSLRFAAKCLSQLDPRVYEPIVAGEWLDGFDWEARFGSIQCPALLLQADPDAGGMLLDADADRLASLLPDLTRVRCQGVGHLIHWQQTELLLRCVQNFLDTL